MSENSNHKQMFIPGTFTIVSNLDTIINLDAYAQVIYMWLCRFAGNKYSCFPSANKLMKATNMSRSKVFESLKMLETAGVIGINNRKNGQINTSNEYFIYIISTPESAEKMFKVEEETNIGSPYSVLGVDRNTDYGSTPHNLGVDRNTTTNSINLNINKEEYQPSKLGNTTGVKSSPLEEDLDSSKEEDTTEEDIEHPELGFPTPEGWEYDYLGETAEGVAVKVFMRNGVRVKQSEISQLRKLYIQKQSRKVAAQKGAETRKETMTMFSRTAVKQLALAQGLSFLDGGENYKAAMEFKDKFVAHLTKDRMIDYGTLDDVTLVGYFVNDFLKKAKQNDFHWRNMTSFGYINRNFNKIVRDFSGGTSDNTDMKLARSNKMRL